MTTFKWILAIISSSIVSSYATFELSTHRHKNNEASARAAINTYITTTTPHKKNSVDTQDKKEVSCEKNENYRPTADSFYPNNDTNTTELITPSHSAAEQESIGDTRSNYKRETQNISLFRQRTSNDQEDVLSRINDKYESEPMDIDWGITRENELLALFDNIEELKSTSPIELGCKSQNCRIVLPVEDQYQGQSLYQSLLRASHNNNSATPNETISYFDKSDNGEIIIYLSRNGSASLFE